MNIFRKLLWVVLLTVPSFPAVGQPDDSLRLFRMMIGDLYNSMSFSGVDFNVTQIDLIDYPIGIAFARYDKSQGKRQILINSNYLYENYWQSKTKIGRDSVQDQIKGLLAHEWAHHFMGHTFDQNTRQKERNADILAGRIIFDQIDSLGPAPTNAYIAQLEERAGLVSDWYDEQATTNYHLGRAARRNLIRKGFFTSLILQKDPLQWLKKKIVAGLVVKSDKIKLLEGTIREIIQRHVKTAESEFNQKLLEISKDTTQDSLCRLKISKVALLYKEPTSATVVGPLTTNADTIAEGCHQIDSFFHALNRKFQSSARIAISGWVGDLENHSRRSPLEFIDKDAPGERIRINRDRFDTEAYYNLYYIDPKKYGDPDLIDLYIIGTKFDVTSSPKSFSFTLNGEVSISINISDDLSTGTVKYFEDGQLTNEATLQKTATANTKCKANFPYYFIIDESKYYLDDHHHLWIETLGASPLCNKLFLQHNSTK